jgi:hypothetical protein
MVWRGRGRRRRLVNSIKPTPCPKNENIKREKEIQNAPVSRRGCVEKEGCNLPKQNRLCKRKYKTFSGPNKSEEAQTNKTERVTVADPIAVIVRGVRYENMGDCAKAFKMTRSSISRAYKNGRLDQVGLGLRGSKPRTAGYRDPYKPIFDLPPQYDPLKPKPEGPVL